MSDPPVVMTTWWQQQLDGMRLARERADVARQEGLERQRFAASARKVRASLVASRSYPNLDDLVAAYGGFQRVPAETWAKWDDLMPRGSRVTPGVTARNTKKPLRH